MAWSIVLANIERELNRMFVFQETEVMPGYLEKYLKDSLAKDRHKWRKHYMLHRQRYKNALSSILTLAVRIGILRRDRWRVKR